MRRSTGFLLSILILYRKISLVRIIMSVVFYFLRTAITIGFTASCVVSGFIPNVDL